MAASKVVYLDPQQMCDYVLLRHVNVGKDAENEKLYKKWTRLWVVVHSQVSPHNSYMGYCKKESKWLHDNESIVKYPLNDFTLSMISTKKHDKVMKLDFPSLTIEMSFDSQTKMDYYFKILSGVSMRHHVDLVRAPEHPDREGDYIVEDCSESYKVWKTLSDCRGILDWEWNLKTIRRIHYHKNVEKLEIEAGRSSQTGEGHFYFTGRHAYRLFEAMKTELMARAQQKIQSQQHNNRSLPTTSSSSSPTSSASSSSSSSTREPVKSNLARSSSVASAVKPKSLASNTHLHSSAPLKPAPHQQASPSSGHRPLTAHLSHSNGALPPRHTGSLEGSDTSSEDYSPSDNSSSFTGTGGSIQDWTNSSPVPSFDRPPFLPSRMTDGRPFSPCSTTSSSSSSTSGYSVPRRLFPPGALPPPRVPPHQQPQYMQVKRDEMDGDNDYMTMNAAFKNKIHLTSDSGAGTVDEDEEDEEEIDEDDSGYTDMHSARAMADGASSYEIADQYMHMVPIGDNRTATLTRNRAHHKSSDRSTSVPALSPPPIPPQLASRFRQMEIIESSCNSSNNSNTFPGAKRDAANC